MQAVKSAQVIGNTKDLVGELAKHFTWNECFKNVQVSKLWGDAISTAIFENYNCFTSSLPEFIKSNLSEDCGFSEIISIMKKHLYPVDKLVDEIGMTWAVTFENNYLVFTDEFSCTIDLQNSDSF